MGAAGANEPRGRARQGAVALVGVVALAVAVTLSTGGPPAGAQISTTSSPEPTNAPTSSSPSPTVLPPSSAPPPTEAPTSTTPPTAPATEPGSPTTARAAPRDTTTTIARGVPTTTTPPFVPPAGNQAPATTVAVAEAARAENIDASWALWLFILGVSGALVICGTRWLQTRPHGGR